MLAPILLTLAALATPQQWRSDIDHLMSELPKRHPNAFAVTPKSTFVSQLESLKADVEQRTDLEIVIAMQQAVASLHDAHTRVVLDGSFHYYPLTLYRFGNELYVTRTARAACAARLVAIDGIDAADVYARVATTVSAENDLWLAALVPGEIVRAETLHATGVTRSVERARFTFEQNGVRFDVELDAANSPMPAPVDGPATPLYQQNARSNYWYVWDAERKLMYVKYNVCANDPARPFSAFASEIFRIVDSEQVDRFVVDIRNNGGGNSAVIDPLVNGLRARDWLRGRLFAIIGRETFSSGLMAARDLRAAGAKLIGEPTGGKPNSYGEVKSFVLPNSRVTVRHSSKYFTLASGSDASSIEPEIRIDLTPAHYFARRDPVLDAIVPPVPSSPPATFPPMRRRAVKGSAYSCD